VAVGRVGEHPILEQIGQRLAQPRLAERRCADRGRVHVEPVEDQVEGA